MPRISVREYRGCERAEIECAPLCLVSGRNAQGKTSLLQAVAAALTGTALPPGMTKSNAGALVRLGAGSASVEVRTDQGVARMTWPDCSHTASGTPPAVSKVAAGLESVVDMPGDARARYLSDLLKAAPTREDLAAALADKGIEGSKALDTIWGLIDDKGWDGAHQTRRDKGVEWKGRWRQVTGQNYGSRIAASWVPPDWSDDLDRISAEELDSLVSVAREAHRAGIAADAASDARRADLEEHAAKLNERVAEVQRATAALAEAEAHERQARATRDALPATDTGQRPTIPCPCGCDPPIRLYAYTKLTEVVVEKAPTAPAPADPAELKRLRLARATAEGDLSNAQATVAAARRAVAAAEAAVEASRKAREDLDQLPPARANGTSSADTEGAVVLAEKRRDALNTKLQADEIRDRIATNDLVLDILAPDGLRARKLRDVLDLFNSGQLAPLCDAAEWKRIEITPEMAVTYGGRDYRILSASEQFRVRVVLQVATARLDGSAMCVVDAAEILDAPARSQLFALLEEARLCALIAMTLSRPNQVPDLAAAGLGVSVWIERGIAHPIGDAKQEAA
ncbi:MAG: hypothetical protein AB7H90_00995 [Alphaproteobacteria bacterium]